MQMHQGRLRTQVLGKDIVTGQPILYEQVCLCLRGVRDSIANSECDGQSSSYVLPPRPIETCTLHLVLRSCVNGVNEILGACADEKNVTECIAIHLMYYDPSYMQSMVTRSMTARRLELETWSRALSLSSHRCLPWATGIITRRERKKSRSPLICTKKIPRLEPLGLMGKATHNKLCCARQAEHAGAHPVCRCFTTTLSNKKSIAKRGPSATKLRSPLLTRVHGMFNAAGGGVSQQLPV